MTEFEEFLSKLDLIKESIAKSAHDDETKLSLLHGALLGLLEINPDNIISDEERLAKWEECDCDD